MKRLLLLPITGLTLGIAMIALLLVSNIYTWHRLTSEAPIAELRFTRLGPAEYEAIVAWGDFCIQERYHLYGEQWRLDAQFIKWRPWASLLGFDARYRLERLGGRYRSPADEMSGRRLVHELDSDGHADLARLVARYAGPLSPLDTRYGSSVYMDMDERYLYRVYRSQSGLLVRTLPAVADDLTTDALTIHIDSACHEE